MRTNLKKQSESGYIERTLRKGVPAMPRTAKPKMGRPPLKIRKVKTIVYLDPNLRDDIDRQCEDLGISRSEFISKVMHQSVSSRDIT